MVYFVDVDNTICQTEGSNYENAIPIPENIKKINRLFDSGNVVVYYTSRGMRSRVNHHCLTLQQLAEWGCHYNTLRMDKPSFDYIIDDRALRIEQL